MTGSERWQLIEKLFLQALDRQGGRLTFLRDACGGDVDLYEEVESLLTHWQQSGDSLQLPTPDPLIGRNVSRYHIVERIGAGGMGSVYRARDPQLARDVALKFVPEELARDDEALQRFQREARAASALDHPGICTVYDVGEHEGRPFIVMQLLEGQTLKHRLAQDTLDLRTVMELARQVASALAAAHRKGIIHRDIKPANIFLTQDGQTKILDFGIAKLTHLAKRALAVPLDTNTLTGVGLVVGTVEYMSPEQVIGREVDGRSDVFSLGAVLYEALTRESAFGSSTIGETLNRIARVQPRRPAEVDSRVSQSLERIVLRCLEKEPELRYQSMTELLSDLQSGKSPESTSRRFFLRSAVMAGILTAALAAVAVIGPLM